MSKLVEVKLEDGSTIYLQATENVEPPAQIVNPTEPPREMTRADYGAGEKGIGDWVRSAKTYVSETPQQLASQSFQMIDSTIRAYTSSSLNAIKQVKSANIDKVTLEFGIEIGGEAGVPYVTKGTTNCNLKITVECSFPNPSNEEA